MKRNRLWIISVVFLLIGILINIAPDFLVEIVLKSMKVDPNKTITGSFLSIGFSVSMGNLIERVVGLFSGIPLLINLIAEISDKWWLRGIPEDTQRKLKKFIEMLKRKEQSKKFFGKTYVQRGSCSIITLNRNVEPDFLMLIRGLEEVRACADGRRDAYGHFEKLQANDYEQLFGSVTESYYTTSLGDHNVWVIFEDSDLEYYSANVSKDQDLKDNKKKSKIAGIHRIFILGEDKSNISIDKNLLTTFTVALNRFLNNDPQPFDILASAVGINISRTHTDVKNEFEENPKIQLLYVLLACKIHEILKIDFSVVKSNRIDMSRLLLSDSEEEVHAKWKSTGWIRLGSALLDNFMAAYAEIKAETKTIICYKFIHDVDEAFSKEVKFLLFNPSYCKFNSLDDTLKDIVRDNNFNNTANQLAERIIKCQRKKINNWGIRLTQVLRRASFHRRVAGVKRIGINK